MPTFTISSCASAISRLGAAPVLLTATLHLEHGRVSSRSRITERPKASWPCTSTDFRWTWIRFWPSPRNTISCDRRRGRDDRPDIPRSPVRIARRHLHVQLLSNKHVTTGEGVMIVTDDAELAEKCEIFAISTCRPAPVRSRELGWNLRMTNLQAALGLAQLERLDEFVPRSATSSTAIRHSSPT